MDGFLALAYPWVKAFHIMAVISWMAGLFYLPRLYVYHAEREARPEPVQSFEIMEEKLLRVIMNPAMIASWLAGLTLVLTPGIVVWSEIWPWTKAGGLIGMTWFHMWLAGQRKAMLRGQILRGRSYRMMNEVPTLLMILIVLSVVVKF
ncbi:MAG: CopD family protein [Paracoccus sp. (in: a-proteobacteria)]|nr:CopD family protein [Paracoccus sp. (in: a-proteobacteria)]